MQQQHSHKATVQSQTTATQKLHYARPKATFAHNKLVDMEKVHCRSQSSIRNCRM
jgi:hypothetical protein